MFYARSQDIIYYENGAKHRERIRLEKDKQKEIVYYPSGQKSSEAFLKDGRYTGTAKTYYESGQLQAKGKVRTIRVKLPKRLSDNEERERTTVMSGRWCSWYDDGKPMKLIVWRRGYMKKTISWDKQGKVIEKRRFWFKKIVFGNFGEGDGEEEREREKGKKRD